jgi:uncharacterized protein
MTIRLTRVSVSTLIGVLLAVGNGCGSDAPDRSEVVGVLADSVAVSAYRQFAGLVAELSTATTQLCDEPSAADLADARTVLADARSEWRQTEAVWVGPVMDRRSWALIDWPIAPDDIDALLADGSVGPLDASFLASRVGATQRGLGAIEYILFANGSDTIDALADDRRCQYLEGLVQVVSDEADTVLELWTTGDGDGPPFRDEFAGETDLMTATDSIDELVNSMLTRLEGSVNRELGRALGLASGPADASGIIEGAGAFGVADQAARAEGIRLVLLGRDGLSGLSPLLDRDLRARLTAQFDALDDALDDIDPPLVDAITNDTSAVQAAHDAYAKLRVTVSTELVSALGVTVSFSDADGDSAG